MTMFFCEKIQIIRWVRIYGTKTDTMRTYVSLLVFILTTAFHRADAQQSFQIVLPDAEILADKLVRGDADTYGLGDWRCTFRASIDGTFLLLEGDIVFSEKANDYTVITGAFRSRIEVGELAKCRLCDVALEEAEGVVAGPNIGARGYRWYKGQGIVRRARIVTDTFGEDVGRIGGTVEFAPIRVTVRCDYAAAGE